MEPLSRENFEDALSRIRRTLPYPSPIKRSKWLSELTGGEVYLKLECLNPGNSFKIRGATNALLSQPTVPKKVITASGGNHGLGVAIAAKSLDVHPIIYLPTTTPEYFIDMLKSHGAEVVLHGDSWDESNVKAISISKKFEIPYIHAFADLKVIEGQGTISMEVDQQIGVFDTLIASVGGGGLITGCSMALDAIERSDTEVISVETIGADSMFQSLDAGKPVQLPAITSIAGTLGARRTTDEIFSYLHHRVSQYHRVSDEEAIMAISAFLDNEKLLIEPATSCIIASLIGGKIDIENKRAVIVVCGSNVTVNTVRSWIDNIGSGVFI